MSSQQQTQRKKLNMNKINLVLDIALALLFIVEMEEHFTGSAWHEVLGLFFAGAFLIHIILHLTWVVRITQTFFRKTLHESRLNYVLNWALLVALGLTTVSGILISRTLGLNFSLSQTAMNDWKFIHTIAAESSLIIIGLHVAMHWKWIATYGKKYLFSLPRFATRRSPVAANAAQTTKV